MRKLGAVLAYGQLSEMTAVTGAVGAMFDADATEKLSDKLARRIFGASEPKRIARGRTPPIDWPAMRAMIKTSPALTAEAKAEALARLDELEKRSCQTRH